VSELAPVRRAEPLRVLLLLDDRTLDASAANAVVRALERTGRAVDVEWVKDSESMQEAMRTRAWDLVVSGEPASGTAIAPTVARKLSHDLVNTFSVIASYVEFLLTDLAPTHPSRKDAEAIQRATQRGLDRVRQIFDRK